jgi:hypothetical protein
MKIRILITAVVFLSALSAAFNSCRPQRISGMNPAIDTMYTAIPGLGPAIQFYFLKGDEHNHPLMAIWIEDTTGRYLQTLYVAESIAKGTFRHGETSTGKWLPGEIRRPAALPVWAHSRNIKEEDGLFIPTSKTPVADAYTGATPSGNFLIESHIEYNINEFDIYFEVNQSWDWNNFWNNQKFPGDEQYKTSCQPSLVYKARITDEDLGKEIELNPVGHGHYSGNNGEIYHDLSTITTALKITQKAYVVVK